MADSLRPDGSGEASPTRRSTTARSRPQRFAPLLLAAAFGCLLAAVAAVRTAGAGPAAPDSASADTLEAAARDSLLAEVQKYTALLSTLRDSLSDDGRRTRIGEADEAFDMALEEFGGVLSQLSKELSGLDLDIGDQSISLRDGEGEGIVIDIPEDLGEQISRGISSITTRILSEIPDTLDFHAETRRLPQGFRVPRAPRARHIINGDAVKLWDDVLVAEDEEIRGNVVVVFGNAMVAGRVDGDVIGVFSDVELGETAEVTGQVFALGRLYQDDAARVGDDVMVLNPPLLPGEYEGFGIVFQGGWLSFLARQVEFVLVAMLVLLLLVILPAERLRSAGRALRDHAGACLGYGLLATILGHIGLVVLFFVLVLTVIGIPLALLLLLGYIAFGLAAVALAAIRVGAKVSAFLGREWRQPWALALCGLVVLHAISFLGSLMGLWPLLGPPGILFGVLGVAVKFLAFCYGVGAIVLSRLGTRPAEAPAVGAEPAASPAEG